MKLVRASKRVAAKLPGIRAHLAQKQLNEVVRLQEDELSGLRQAVDRLEARNKEWAKEVDVLRGVPGSREIVWPVAKADLFLARYAKPTASKQRKKPPYTLNWVIPPMGKASGGHTTILRAVQYLESRGHICRVYVYDPQGQLTLERVKGLLDNAEDYPQIRAEIYYNEKNMLPSDGIFATSWHTAYPVANDTSGAKKFYFVQDFEPTFDPVGTYSTLAENTYKFGLHGVTIGRWLSEKLSKEYGMPCDPFEFGVNSKQYYLTNKGRRNKVLFYARPVTPRRGFELGVLSLELFHKANPDFEIHMVGWDIAPIDIPFPYVNHGVLPHDKLNKLYNECAAGLVLSFTNMSLLPLELLAAGCTPVVNDAEHTRAVGYADMIAYADPLPKVIAAQLATVAKQQRRSQDSQRLSKAANRFGWENALEKVDAIITQQLS